MMSLVTLFSLYIAAILVGRKYGHHASQSAVLLALIAFVQVVVVLIAMFVMDPPGMMRGGQ